MEATALIAALILSLLGIGITDYSPGQSYRYWGGMTLVLAVAGIAIGWSTTRRLGMPARATLIAQLIHWCATGIAVTGVFLLLKAGRLNYENTGLVLLLTLGLSTFLDGCRVSWRFGLIGLLMFVTGIVAAYAEEYLWVLLIIAVGVAIFTFIWGRYRSAKAHHVQAGSPAPPAGSAR